MRRAARWLVLPAAAVLVALVLAGCGGGGSDPGAGETTAAQTTANTAFCADLAALRRAAGDLTGLDPANTTVNELALAAANLGAAWKTLRASAKDATGVNTAALADAWRGVLAQAKELSGSNASPAAAVEALKTAAIPLGNAADDLTPGCAAAS